MMRDYLLLMHNDTSATPDATGWATYLDGLRRAGALRGGSAIGSGQCFRRDGTAPPVAGHLAGFVRIEARDLEHARELLSGNPVFEAGGTVEVRELPHSD